jgi:hypothetical protein
LLIAVIQIEHPVQLWTGKFDISRYRENGIWNLCRNATRIDYIDADECKLENAKKSVSNLRCDTSCAIDIRRQNSTVLEVKQALQEVLGIQVD